MLWDFIIIGGGSAGCVLADRLSADPARKVLLLEAGGSGSSPFVRVPNGIFFLKGKPSHHWLVETAPDPTRAGRRETLTCGKGLGGGSAVNGMVYVRGLAADYAHWEERAGPLWSLAAVTAAFDRAESVIGPAIPEDMHPLAAAFLESAVASGLPRLATTSIPEDPGVMACPSSAARGLRRSTAATYLKRARRRPNLTVITGAEAERLIADGRRIRAVGYRKGGRRRIAEARQEVILSCGSINTPKILMLSGIGPADHLQSHGIKVLHHSPGVGLGLQDHPCIWVSAETSVPSWNDVFTPWGMAGAGLEWLLRRRGPAASAMCQVTAYGSSGREVEDRTPDFQINMTPTGYKVLDHGVEFLPGSSMTAAVSLCRPQGRGHVRLRSADPGQPPEVVYNLLDSPDEVARLTAACRMVREIYGTDPLKRLIKGEAFPGPAVESDADWADYIRRHSVNMCHPVGSCAMGLDPASVVDERLRLRGLGGIRLVDASVMPRITSGNTNAPSIMIAERAAELILEEYA